MSTRFLDPTATQLHTRQKTASVQLAWLERWHLLSLDAPCVSALWTWFLVRCAGKHPSPATLLAMFLAVWILYAGDRLLDARAVFGGMDDVLEERHFFHSRHWRRFLIGIAAAAVALSIALVKMPRPLLDAYLVLSTLLALWLGIIHTSRTPARLPKEFAVGLFFGVAVALPSGMTGSQGAGFFTGVLGASLMCTANCLFLLSWESSRRRLRSTPRGDDRSVLVHPSATFAVRRLVPLCATAAWLCIVGSCIVAIALHRATAACPLAAAALSLAMLLLLHHMRHHLAATTLRALADVALLTPLLFAPLFLPHLLLRAVLR